MLHTGKRLLLRIFPDLTSIYEQSIRFIHIITEFITCGLHYVSYYLAVSEIHLTTVSFYKKEFFQLKIMN